MEDGENRDFGKTVLLVRSAQDGDRQAMEALFARYLPRARAIAALRMGRRLSEIVELEDIVQDALLKAFQGLNRFEHKSEGSFRNWLAQCIECEVVNVARKADAQKRGGGKVRRFGDFNTSDLSTSIFASREPSPSAVARGKEMGNQVEEALIQMPEHYREVIILRFISKMSYDEIAEAMGFDHEATARKACSRALQKLKEKMELK